MGVAETLEPVRLGRYQVLKHLASGGMAEVSLARASGIEGFERYVVIKRIRQENAHDARFVKMFLDEARLAASLHHQNIVQVHDIGSEDGAYFFAMEYIHGEDLRKLLFHVRRANAFVPFEHVIAIATAAAAGLHHAHDLRGSDRKLLGIVHRDVSLGNILIGYDGSVKVADFGIAKAGQRETETRSGVMKGKVAYMSPEGCVGQQVDRRSDVYALGVVLYELATVKRLFKGDNDFLTMTAIVEGEIPPPSTDRPDFPAELEAIIMKALARAPTDRYQTADELRAALNQFAINAELHTSTTGLADYMKSLFGERPVPWLDETSEPEVAMDFDTHVEGVVEAPSDASGLAHDIASDAPIAVARRVLQLDSVVGAARRRKRLLVGAGAALALVIVVLVAMAGSGGSPATPAASTPAAVKPIEPVGEPIGAGPPARVEPVPPSDPIELEPIATGSAAEPSAKPRPVVKKPPVKRPSTATKWDPNSLFPK